MNYMDVILDEFERQLNRASECLVPPDEDMTTARFWLGGCSAMVDVIRRLRVDGFAMTAEQLERYDWLLGDLNSGEEQFSTGEPFDPDTLMRGMFGLDK